jgi:Pentapeptide repeats (8 copies)
LATALWLCVALLPRKLYPSLSASDLAGLNPAEQAERREGRDRLQNDTRTTLLQGLAALLVLTGAGIGAAVTLRQVRIGRDQLQQAREQAQLSDARAREQLELSREQALRSDERLNEQIALAEEGQITDRFTRAVDQLGQPGPDRLDVRLGGMYALERIAHDSSTHRLAVIEILSAFVRSHSPWPPRLPGQYRADAPIDRVPSLEIRALDVQTALTIIGRRPTQEDDPLLDLNGTDLRKADLREANLKGARLVAVNLSRARLGEVDMEHAELVGVNLEVARLFRANLRGAGLVRASLKGASLIGANLRGARLDGANLRETTLTGADLEDAGLDGAVANQKTHWPRGWDRTRRAAARVEEPDEDVPEEAPPTPPLRSSSESAPGLPLGPSPGLSSDADHDDAVEVPDSSTEQ